MDKKFAAMLGAAAAVATVGGAQAATQSNPNPSEAVSTSSYADLLAPVPNAVEQLRADDLARARIPAETGVKLAQDHHHHSTVIIRQPRDQHHHHHHHHHHHTGAFIGIPGVAGVTVGSGENDQRRQHHHHHYDHRD